MTGASSRIAKAIEALSGRIDFLKQSLTIALAGVAGVAVLFTDPDKVPRSLTGIIAICIAALALLAAAAIAYMGLSAYANALLTLEKGQNPQRFRKSVLTHAQGVFVALAVAAIAITVFAASQIGAGGPKELTANPSQSLDLAWGTLARRGLDVQLRRFAREGDDYVGRFTLRTATRIAVEGAEKNNDPDQPAISPASQPLYVVRIDGKTGKLRAISRETEKPAGGRQTAEGDLTRH